MTSKISLNGKFFKRFLNRLPIATVRPFVITLSLLNLALFLLVVKASAQNFRNISDAIDAPKGGIMGIAQDQQGFMWYASTNGLYRYDTRKFKRYGHDRENPKSLTSDYLSAILCDSEGKLWIGTWAGLNRYDKVNDTFTAFRNNPNDNNSISGDTIYCIAEDNQKRIWIGTSSGLNCFERKDGKNKFTRYLQQNTIEPKVQVQSISIGNNGELWLATSNGLIWMDGQKTKVFKPNYNTGSPVTSDFVTVFNDGIGNVWLGAKNGGLFRFNIASQGFRFMEGFKGASTEWPVVSGFVKDKNSKLWISTWSGLAHFDLNSYTTQWYLNDPEVLLSLADNHINSLFKDNQEGIWLGSYYKGIQYLDTKSPRFSQWPFNINRYSKSKFIGGQLGITPHGKPWLLAGDKSEILFYNFETGQISKYALNLEFAIGINHFYIDAHDVLWCGRNAVLYSYNIKTGKRQDYLFPDQSKTINARGRIYRMIEASDGSLWLGGSFGLLNFDKQSRTFRKIELKNFIVSIFEDSKHNIWFGGKNEVFLLRSGSDSLESILVNKVSQNDEVTKDDVWRITEDESRRIWLVTLQGLRLYDPAHRLFDRHPKTGALELSGLTDILSDNRGYLWLSKGFELIRYHPDNGSIQSYSHQEGLPKNGMLPTNEAFKDQVGRFYYPTNEELFSFEPNAVVTNNSYSSVVITSVRLFNKEIKSGDSTGIIHGELSKQKELVFEHDQNIFTLDFAYLSFAKSHRNNYRYQLLGFEDNWTEAESPSVTYMNLPAGKYTFMVQAANGDGYWTGEPLSINITVLSPWWKTWYAYILYILLIGAVIYLVTRFFWLRTNLRKENELYQVKLDFFTNLSHEVRTHLSLIIGPLEKAFGSLPDNQPAKTYLTYARNNSVKLMQLVNELLDFRKIKSKSVILSVYEYDLVKVFKNILASFEHVAKEKGIALQFKHSEEVVDIWIDLSQMQKVFYNLLSNSFKFTPEGGKVIIEIVTLPNEVVVKIIDNGRGIAPQHLNQLFDNFFQPNDQDDLYSGYGIGLALSKAIVDLHQGFLTVTSRIPNGGQNGETCFMLKLLTGKGHYAYDQLGKSETANVNAFSFGSGNENEQDRLKGTDKKNCILIVEDNDELRAFEEEIFAEAYQVLTAANGAEGLKMAFEHIPDLILSDVMMPELNGLQLCSNLKSDIRTSHIPVIMLTARGAVNQIVEGLAVGADDYLVKPFDPNVLSLKVSNLIRMREELRHYYNKILVLDSDDKLTDNSNSKFISRLKDLVIQNLSESSFGVNEMAFQADMSVSVLYRKLRSLTGMTVNDFMKTIRMKRALQLLESGSLNVNEVAMIVGYEDVRYFSREFKKVYQKSPSQIRNDKDDES